MGQRFETDICSLRRNYQEQINHAESTLRCNRAFLDRLQQYDCGRGRLHHNPEQDPKRADGCMRCSHCHAPLTPLTIREQTDALQARIADGKQASAELAELQVECPHPQLKQTQEDEVLLRVTCQECDHSYYVKTGLVSDLL